MSFSFLNRLTSQNPFVSRPSSNLPAPVRDALPPPDRLGPTPRARPAPRAAAERPLQLPQEPIILAAPRSLPAHAPAQEISMTSQHKQALQSRTAPDKLFIGGEFVTARGTPLELINPATGGVMGICPAASAEDVQDAIGSARTAFDSGVWSSRPADERARILELFAQEVSKGREALACIDVLNAGKPLEEALGDIDDVAKCLTYYAGLARTHALRGNRKIPLDDAAFVSHEESWPRGVVAAITPWNYPMLMAIWKVAPALAAGCSVVLKPSELTPWTALELGSIAQKVGLPKGVLNIVPGLGATAGAALTASKDVDYIAFTGSVTTGKRVMHSAADNVTPVSLELGGKSPIVVCDDADLDKAVEAIRLGVFFNQGEVCSSTSRLIVHEKVADALLTRLTEMAASIQVGDGLDEGVTMGPIISQAQYAKVMDYIASAKAEGATLVCGGERPKDLAHGYFVLPTIFKNVTSSMRIWREEIFGPVLAVTTYKDDAEAVRLANDTEFGLAAAVISRDPARCTYFSRNIQAGIVWKNTSQPTFVQAPWSPWKQSGFGVNLSEHGFEEYLKFKQVTELKD